MGSTLYQMRFSGEGYMGIINVKGRSLKGYGWSPLVVKSCAIEVGQILLTKR